MLMCSLVLDLCCLTAMYTGLDREVCWHRWIRAVHKPRSTSGSSSSWRTAIRSSSGAWHRTRANSSSRDGSAFSSGWRGGCSARGGWGNRSRRDGSSG